MLLYFQPEMYSLFLRLMERYAEMCGISVLAVCLMPNHFHLLVRVERGGDVAEFMKRLCGRYSVIVNTILKRTGTIFEGRYHMRHVHDDRYFKALCRYIHLNPVRSAIVNRPELYGHSNYLECVGRRNLIHTSHEIITSMFGGAKAYEMFVLDGLDKLRLVELELADSLAAMKVV